MTDIQARHAPAVLANKLTVATEWGHPDRGYVLLFRPSPAASAGLVRVQDQVQALEPSLLRQPEPQLHGSIAWLLAVARDFDAPKDEIWARHGEDWLKIAGVLADSTPPIRLRYRRLVATDAAIVAVAQEPNPLAGFRSALIDGLGLPWPITYRELGIVHTSLFRYAGPLTDPAGLVRRLAELPVSVETEVSEMLMVREVTYPMLDYEIVRRLPLRG